MAPIFLKPENAVKRAEELLEVSQPEEALTTLHETLTSRKSKLAPVTALEPLAVKLVELCVQLRRGRTAREALVQFKNMSHNTNIASMERVVKAFLDLAEAKLTDAVAETTHGKALEGAEESIVAAVEDLETPETPEALLYASVNLSSELDRSDRVVLMPWLKFLWEAYRTVLDVLRNNSRLELLYQQTAGQAFSFCLRFKRKNEFRRLCDNLRNHLTSIPRFTHQHSINLSDPEVLQRFLDTRFVQLQTASDLELWQESFRSVEDIYQLLIMAGSLIAPSTPENPQPMAGLLPAALFTNKVHGPKMMQMLAQYYEKLTRIFAVSGDGLFLAASWNKYHAWVTHMRGHTTLTDAEQNRLAGDVLLSALSVPVVNTTATTQYSTSTSLEQLVNSPGSLADQDTNLISVTRANRRSRLATMLGLSRIPSRIALVQEAIGKGVLGRVSADLKKLYELLEVSFHPLTAAKHIGPLLQSLSADKDAAKYVDDIRTVVVTKILKEVSLLYTTISIESLVEITSMADAPMTAYKLERFVLQGNHQHEFRIRVNHLTGTFDFVSDPMVTDPYAGQQTKPLHAATTAPSFERMRYELTKFASSMVAALDMFEPERREQLKTQKRDAFARARASMEAEHRQALERKNIIERKKEIVETRQQKKEAAEAKARALKAEQDRIAHQARLAEEAKQRELAKLQREQEEIKRQETKRLVDSLKEKANIIIKDEDLTKVDSREILAVQVEQMEREKAEQDARMRSQAKRMDHLERACRKEEIPLLEADYERQKVHDREAHVEARKRLVDNARARHAEEVAIKSRVTRMKDDYLALRAAKATSKEEDLQKAREEAQAKIDAAKAERREEVRRRFLERKAELEREEEEALRLEEEEIEREHRQEQEARAKQQRDRETYEANQRRQMGEAGEQAPAPAAPGKWVPGRQRAEGPSAVAPAAPSGAWAPNRPRPEAAPAAAAAAPSDGKWMPANRRAQESADTANVWRRPTAPAAAPAAAAAAAPAPVREEQRPAPGVWRPSRATDSPARRDDGPSAAPARSSPAPPSAASTGAAATPSPGAWKPKRQLANGSDSSNAPPTSGTDRWRNARKRGNSVGGAKSPSSPVAGGVGVQPPTTSVEQDEAQSREIALARLSDVLRHPDDLNTKLEVLRKKIASEKTVIEAQLKAGTQTQLDDCQTGLDNLFKTRDELEQVRKNLKVTDEACAQSKDMIPSFGKIKLLSKAHRNFVTTRETLIKFQGLNERVERVRGSLDDHSRNPLGSAPDLLFMHYELFLLEEFRANTMAQMKGASAEVVDTLTIYFRRLDDLSQRFTDYLWDLARHALDLINAGQGSVLVRLAKIIEHEEKADEAALAARASRNGSSSSLNAQGNVNPLRIIKSYRSMLFDVLHESISEKFEMHYAQLKDETVKLFTELRAFVIQDLTIVYDDLVSKFPPKYKIFPFFVLEYHRHVFDTVNRVITDNLETGAILFLLRWVREYYEEMNSKLGITEELLEPKLLDGQEGVLVEDYLKLVKQKLDEWMHNLLTTETREFQTREQPPEVDTQEHYQLAAPVIMFNMVNQQIDIAMDSSRGQLLQDVIVECKQVLFTYQNHFTQVLTQEYNRFSADPSKCPGGVIEYTMALANDNLRCTEFVDLIIKRVENDAEPDYREHMLRDLNDAMDGFMKLAKTACSVLIDFAFHDVKPAFQRLFVPPAWYDNELMNDIIATLNDYCTDYQTHLQEYLFGKLITDMMDRFLLLYIDAMRNKQVKLRLPQARDRMNSDLSNVISFFAQFKSAKRVEKHFELMEKLFTVVCSSKRMIFVDYYSLAKSYSDVPLPFIEDVLLKRDDMDKPTVKEIMESIRQKAKDVPPDAPKSVFSRLSEAK
ncbi:SNARE-binding exocyst subunit S6 [Sorochytrium milnesiophthora]